MSKTKIIHLISFLVAMVVAASCMLTTALAAEEMTVTVHGPEGVYARGDAFTVIVEVSNNTGFTGFQFSLDYDPDVLELTALEAGELCTGSFVPNVKNGVVVYSHNGGTVTEDGVLFHASFVVIAAASPEETTVRVAAEDMFGPQHERLTVHSVGCTVSLHSHIYGDQWMSDGAGHWLACSCGESTDPLPHTWDEGTITTQPGCTTDGVRTFACTACGWTKTETVAATGHAADLLWQKDDREHWLECTCGLRMNAGAHTWNEGVVTREPTEKEMGIRVFTCTDCAAEKTEEIPALGGDEQNTEKIPTIGAKSESHTWVFVALGAVLAAAAVLVFFYLKKKR